MTETTKPSKESVRAYMERRTHPPVEPPPSPEEIRQQLDWHMLRDVQRPDHKEIE